MDCSHVVDVDSTHGFSRVFHYSDSLAKPCADSTVDTQKVCFIKCLFILQQETKRRREITLFKQRFKSFDTLLTIQPPTLSPVQRKLCETFLNVAPTLHNKVRLHNATHKRALNTTTQPPRLHWRFCYNKATTLTCRSRSSRP